MHSRISRLWLIAPLSDGLHVYGVEAYPYKGLIYPTANIRIPPRASRVAIDRKFNDLFERWQKLTDKKLSELFKRSEINESALFKKLLPHPAQVNSVK